MERTKLLGLIIKQAREDKGWTQQELADKLELSIDTEKSYEEGTDSPDTITLAGYIFLLNIAPDVIFYEDNIEDALRIDRMYRDLQTLSDEQFDKLMKSAEHIRLWRKNHPDVVTLEDYWKVFNPND